MILSISTGTCVNDEKLMEHRRFSLEKFSSRA